MAMPPRLTEVGALERPDHYHLPADAKCYFWGEYTPREHVDGPVWEYSDTNRLITNFKKKMERKGLGDWHYKTEAIDYVARAFSKFWKWADLHKKHHVALIPVPPSKTRTDPLFDPRMLDMLTAVAKHAGVQLDIRDCLSFSGKYGASHEADNRPTPDDLYGELALDPVAGKIHTAPGTIFLFDDMLTTGAHYVAATRKLSDSFPGVPVIGNFIARRRVPNPLDDFDVL